ncbi:MAG: hypothetical protein HND44_22685 [Chloroflexi bacterium]|nr:hypothetical protein [Chloroflexota bacterium]NOG37348.1 hypothetical protein [Chloroflexota bacterium]
MLADFSSYLLTFTRLAAAFIFALSAANKWRDFPAFTQAIVNFQILPGRGVKPAAVLLATAELAVVAMMLLGGPFLLPGFLLALALLSLFTVALMSVLTRGLHTSCNCFSATARPITAFQVWRNGSFIGCIAAGCLLLPAAPMGMNLLELCLLSIVAATFVLLVNNLEEIVTLVRPV